MYAESNLDELILAQFPSGYVGSFIDVGAAEPIRLSNSYLFEEKGWDVVCIEANPTFAEMLRCGRKRTLEYAVANYDKDGEDFTIYNHSLFGQTSLSGLGRGKVGSKLYNEGIRYVDRQEVIKVNVRKLDSLLAGELSYIKDLDVVSIDTEGTELDVLKGLDLKRWKPGFLIVEDFERDGANEDYLNSFGYAVFKVWFPNTVFIAQCGKAEPITS
jgi:FkbM family methyltransferase